MYASVSVSFVNKFDVLVIDDDGIISKEEIIWSVMMVRFDPSRWLPQQKPLF
ncbi:hypothetical protein H4R99_000149 [Coemansia sp. RSA 1722]|nr:hypothetical protein H4R99_000149 [Coemansia sp. RSA 1722]